MATDERKNGGKEGRGRKRDEIEEECCLEVGIKDVGSAIEQHLKC